MSNQPGIVITLREVYDKLVGVEDLVKGLNCQVVDLKESTKEQLEDHEKRLRLLEERRFPTAQIGALVAVLALILSTVTFLVR